MKRNKSNTWRQRHRPPVGILSTVVFVFVLFAIAAAAVHSLKKLSFFKVKDVTIREGSSIRQDRDDELQYLVGKNIFSLDLKKHAQFIQAMYPAYRTARLIRFLPDQMCLDLMKRTALACIDSNPRLYIDDHMIFFESVDPVIGKGLPVIVGLDGVNKSLRPGTRATNAGVLFAVRVIQQAKKNKTLQGYAIERIFMHDASNASLYLPGPLEVRIGQDKLDDSLQILGSLLNQVGNGVSNIEYIDLRFKDPVIRFKGKEV
jgi:cell division septal protein FtsQ